MPSASVVRALLPQSGYAGSHGADQRAGARRRRRHRGAARGGGGARRPGRAPRTPSPPPAPCRSPRPGSRAAQLVPPVDPGHRGRRDPRQAGPRSVPGGGRAARRRPDALPGGRGRPDGSAGRARRRLLHPGRGHHDDPARNWTPTRSSTTCPRSRFEVADDRIRVRLDATSGLASRSCGGRSAWRRPVRGRGWFGVRRRCGPRPSRPCLASRASRNLRLVSSSGVLRRDFLLARHGSILSCRWGAASDAGEATSAARRPLARRPAGHRLAASSAGSAVLPLRVSSSDDVRLGSLGPPAKGPRCRTRRPRSATG